MNCCDFESVKITNCVLFCVCHFGLLLPNVKQSSIADALFFNRRQLRFNVRAANSAYQPNRPIHFRRRAPVENSVGPWTIGRGRSHTQHRTRKQATQRIPEQLWKTWMIDDGLAIQGQTDIRRTDDRRRNR